MILFFNGLLKRIIPFTIAIALQKQHPVLLDKSPSFTI
jgi:hypothetical protein